MNTQPIERQIHVKADPAEAFRIFTAEMTSWWPIDTFSMAEDGQKTERVVVEERESGRIYEVLSDGSECDWGRVTGWEPGR
ncbi:MAG: SRPBCC domain-containing protein, partial [Actinomycetota bacterium]